MPDADTAAVYVTVKIDATFRDAQNVGDDFSLLITTARTGSWGDPWYLTEAEVRDFRNRLDAALAAYSAAREALSSHDESNSTTTRSGGSDAG